MYGNPLYFDPRRKSCPLQHICYKTASIESRGRVDVLVWLMSRVLPFPIPLYLWWHSNNWPCTQTHHMHAVNTILLFGYVLYIIIVWHADITLYGNVPGWVSFSNVWFLLYLLCPLCSAPVRTKILCMRNKSIIILASFILL